MSNLVEEIKTRCDIVDVVGRYVKLKRSGSNYMGLCPFHSEKTPSFSVSEKGQFFHCFGCGESGDVISFIEKIENVDFMTAAQKLCDQYGIDMEKLGYRSEGRNNEIYEMNRAAAMFFLHQLVDRPGPGLDYVQGRGLTMKTVGQFGLGFAPDSWHSLTDHMHSLGYDDRRLMRAGLISASKGSHYDKFRNRVIFPIINTRGKVIGFGGRLIAPGEPKYLNTPESPVFSKRNNLFGLNLTRKSIARQDQVIIVEGYMDMVSLYQSGITNVAATLGTALTADQCAMLGRYTKNVVLSYDADSAGRKAALRGIEIIRGAGLNARVLHVTDGKDPDEYVQKHGREAFEELVKNALPYAEYKLESVKSRYNLSVPEERMRYTKEAARVLAGLDPVDSEFYRKKLSDETGIPEGTLNREIDDINRSGSAENAVREARRRQDSKADDEKGSLSLQKTLIGIMAADPSTVPEVRKYAYVFADPSCYRVAGLIFSMFDEEGTLDAEKAADTLDAEDAALFNNIVSSGVLGNDVKTILNECVVKIRMDGLKKRHKELENTLALMPEDDPGIEDVMKQLSGIDAEVLKLKKDLGSE